MKILILNGNDDAGKSWFDEYIYRLVETLRESGHTVTHLLLRDLQINYCNGCFKCWVKNPGECPQKDDIGTISGEYVQADFVLKASPLKMGFTSSLLKKVQDRLIGVLLPFIELEDGECRHEKRYGSYPLLGLLVDREERLTDEELDTVFELHRRCARNFHAPLAIAATLNKSALELTNEINSL